MTLPALDDIAWVVLGQIIHADKAFGALFFSKGRSHDTDMLFAGPEFVIKCGVYVTSLHHLPCMLGVSLSHLHAPCGQVLRA